MTTLMRLKNLAGGGAVALMVALALSACGSSDDDDVVAAPDEAGREESAAVPTGAGASVEAFQQFQKNLKRSDESEALITAGFVPPVSDSEEAAAIN